MNEGIGSTRSESLKKGEKSSDERPAHIAGREIVTAAVSGDKPPLIKVSENHKHKNVCTDQSSDQPYPNLHFFFFFFFFFFFLELRIKWIRKAFIIICFFSASFYQLPLLSTFVISFYFIFLIN